MTIDMLVDRGSRRVRRRPSDGEGKGGAGGLVIGEKADPDAGQKGRAQGGRLFDVDGFDDAAGDVRFQPQPDGTARRAALDSYSGQRALRKLLQPIEVGSEREANSLEKSLIHVAAMMANSEPQDGPAARFWIAERGDDAPEGGVDQ